MVRAAVMVVETAVVGRIGGAAVEGAVGARVAAGRDRMDGGRQVLAVAAVVAVVVVRQPSRRSGHQWTTVNASKWTACSRFQSEVVVSSASRE